MSTAASPAVLSSVQLPAELPREVWRAGGDALGAYADRAAFSELGKAIGDELRESLLRRPSPARALLAGRTATGGLTVEELQRAAAAIDEWPMPERAYSVTNQMPPETSRTADAQPPQREYLTCTSQEPQEPFSPRWGWWPYPRPPSPASTS